MNHTFLFLFVTLSAMASTPKVAIHPTPTKPIFVEAAWYETLRQSLDPVPEAGSAKQGQDESELKALQLSRTDTDCKKAEREVKVSLETFYGDIIPAKEARKMNPFFDQLRNDGDYFIQKMKIDYPRKRPFAYVDGIEPCVPREVTGAYPSGHAALSELYALVLTDLYPSKKAALQARAKEISDHRVLSGMHHRSDVEAGRKLAGLLYKEFKKSSEFQQAFASAQKGTRS